MFGGRGFGAIGSAVLAVAALGVGAGSAGAALARESGGLPVGSEQVTLDPAQFTTTIDNPYWPMKPGSQWVYREVGSDGSVTKVVITVTTKTKRVANGLTALVVRDTASEDGQVIEDTFDYYAQDSAGNIWYLGEDTKEFENGKVKTTKGSWEAGVDGAQPGVIVPADPKPGMAYRQEYYAGQAEDNGAILSVGEQADAGGRHYGDVVVTKDTNALKPKTLEFKFYARGVGPVLALGISGGSDREELVRFRAGR